MVQSMLVLLLWERVEEWLEMAFPDRGDRFTTT
jgi:hypothetical protein